MSDTPVTRPPPAGAQSARRPRSAKNIIAVASGKGGVGKTWFSISLSHALAREGKRVLLFDGDLGLANVDVQLGLMPKRDLSDVIEGRLTIERVIYHYDQGGFDIIAGRSGASSLSQLPEARLASLRSDLVGLAQKYDVIILDLGAGIDRTVRMMSAAAGAILVVTNDEPTALTDAYAYIKLSKAAGLSDALNIVVNLARDHKAGERIYRTLQKACQSFLQISPAMAGIIRQDPRVRDAIRHQTPLLIRSPNSEAAEDIETIAARVSEGVCG